MKKSDGLMVLLLCGLLLFMKFQSSIGAEERQLQFADRQKLNFNSGWLFYRGEIPEDAARNPSFPDSTWQAVQLPHSPQILPLRQPWKPANEGIKWYRKHFRLAATSQGKKIFLEFEGADQVTEVWINGTHLVKHIGSYLPFTADLTDFVQYGNRDNLVAVKVNNYNDKDIPAYGRWISYGGLYRDVYLLITNRLHITDAIYAHQPAGGGVFVTYPVVNDSLVEINVKTQVFNEYQQAKNCTVKFYLLDQDGQLVATTSAREMIAASGDHTFDQNIRLTNFQLWHPNHPYLYTLRLEVLDDENRVDSYQTRIGIRRIQFSHDGMTLNGERFLFMGTNRVQEYPYTAWAFPNSAQKRDAIILKEGGFQFVRSSHNPQDPSFLDACDELGILVMDCIPGFQYIGGTQFRENSFQNMREIIRRDRNHPAVILWELSLNETDFDSSFARQAVQIGHEEFPGDQCFVAGWKFPTIYDVFIRASQHGAREYAENKPLVISEYGHWDFRTNGRSTSDVDRKDGEAAMLQQAQNHQRSLNLNRGLPFLSGDGLWVAMDFQCYPSGVIDYFRLPKFSYYFYQSQRDPDLILKAVDSGPMVYIANFWREKWPRPVTVFSNCERVDLLLNGQLLASQPPDTGWFVKNLLHPPFTFTAVAWQPGKLKAIGYLHGQAAVVHERITPGEASNIRLHFDLKGTSTIGDDDMFFVYAMVVDKNGVVVPDVLKEISFHVDGGGILISPEKVETEAGTAVALIRTTDRPDKIIIHAETDGLPEAIITVGRNE